MQAGYLGGVRAAVKAGMGSGLVALLVGIQPVLTAVWMSFHGGRRRGSGSAWCWVSRGWRWWWPASWGRAARSARLLFLALLALLSITAGTLYQKRFVAPCDVRSASAVQQLAALAVTLPLALLLERSSIEWTSGSIGAMAWSVVALTLGGSSLLYMLIQRGTATAVTSLLYLVPPCTAVMAWLLFDERITVLTVAGIALTALGVSLVVREPRPA